MELQELISLSLEETLTDIYTGLGIKTSQSVTELTPDPYIKAQN